MGSIIGSVSKYVQGRNELSRLHDYVSAISQKGVYAIVDAFILENYSDKISHSFIGKEISMTLEKFGGECCKSEIDRIISKMKELDADCIIGVGGGKTMDTAKAVAYYSSVPVVICPTIASSDAPCSAISVLYSEDGKFDKYLYLPKNPDLVIADTQIIANAPVRLFVAGMGDALATFYEARACCATRNKNMYGGESTNAAFALCEKCRDILLSDGYRAKLAVEKNLVTPAVENVIEANTYLSGVGFESCGLAAAHAIQNSFSIINETGTALHGEKVAFCLLVQLVLENSPEDEFSEVMNFCKKVGLPTCLKEIGIDEIDVNSLMEVARLSCSDGETMKNMPQTITPEDVVDAILIANQLGL